MQDNRQYIVKLRNENVELENQMACVMLWETITECRSGRGEDNNIKTEFVSLKCASQQNICLVYVRYVKFEETANHRFDVQHPKRNVKSVVLLWLNCICVYFVTSIVVGLTIIVWIAVRRSRRAALPAEATERTFRTRSWPADLQWTTVAAARRR